MFWLAVGLGAGATAVVLMGRWAKKQARAIAPPNLARQAGDTIKDLGSLVTEVVKEFRTGMAEKESEVRAALE
jgi:DNA-binding IclR family transcriptional regulator